MSKLLNRGNIFIVTRNQFGYAEYQRSAVVGAFSNLDDADDYKGACEQQWIDKVGSLNDVEFEIQLTTYYGS